MLLSASTDFLIGSNWRKVMSAYRRGKRRERYLALYSAQFFSRRRASGRIYPCWPCSSASSLASDKYLSSARMYPHPPSRGSVCADARSSLCFLSTSHEPPSPSHSPRLNYAVISRHTISKTPTGERTYGISRCLVRHCVSSPFFPFHIHRGTHDCRASFHIFLSCRWDWIPLAHAKHSHLVGG